RAAETLARGSRREETRTMALDLRAASFRNLSELRFVATPKRLRARLGDTAVLETRDALLVWEPRRVVPSYAVPPGDLDLTLSEHDPAPVPDQLGPVLPPGHPDWHTVPGTSLHAEGLGEVAFRPEDSALGGRLIMTWEPFEWTEEDQPVTGHPHDPYVRIDVLASDRHVRVELDGVVLAESDRPVALFETGLPVRWYLPVEEVRMDLLTPSDTHSVCAYKGRASYLSAEGGTDVAWYYPDPLRDALPVKDLLCFWRDVTVLVDGEAVPTGMPGEG
ncbi:MAG: DUF427 domain-containing protein, partial [Nocardioides sp.]